MKKGTCVKCGGNEVYSNENLPSRGDRSNVPGHDGRNSSALWINTFVCIECGYFEEYLRDDVLADEKRINRVKLNWKKVAEF